MSSCKFCALAMPKMRLRGHIQKEHGALTLVTFLAASVSASICVSSVAPAVVIKYYFLTSGCSAQRLINVLAVVVAGIACCDSVVKAKKIAPSRVERP